VTQPTGGPKDEIPPELIESYPTNNQKNFKGNSIELIFNEDIKLKDAKDEIIITPSVGKQTKFIAKKRKLIITPEFDLVSNTTYSIAFRDGVQDLTEGNPAENLHLAFSTGPTIDSLQINGSIEELFKDKIPQKITVAVYQSDTFNIFKHQPTYFTKTDKEGNFSIQNLKGGTYYIYSFDDKNKNFLVDSKTEIFGFLTDRYDLTQNIDSIKIPITKVDARELAISSIKNLDKGTILRFNKQIDSLKITGLDPEISIYTFGENKSELIFTHFFNKSDSIKINLSAVDSTNQTIDSTFYIKYTNTKTIESNFATKELKYSIDYYNLNLTHSIKFNKLLKPITYDSIYIQYDSAIYNTIPNENIKFDILNSTIELQTKIDTTLINTKTKSIYPFLKYGKGTFISIDNDSSKQIKKDIKILKEEDLGSVEVEVTTDQPHFEIQIVDVQNNIVQSKRDIKKFTFIYLEPKEYKVIIHIDTNNNGKWDPGNFNKHIEPEKIILYKSEEGKYSFPLRANWTYGPLLIKF
jgi:uncharacterized protein (DUF2141 family)